MVATDVESVDKEVSVEPLFAFGRAAKVEVGVPRYLILHVEGSSHNLRAMGTCGLAGKWLPATQPVEQKTKC